MQILPMADTSVSSQKKEFNPGDIIELADLEEKVADEVCCGGAPAPKSSPLEKPGYRLQPYVSGFIKGARTDIPLVKTRLAAGDHLGTLLARIGVTRDNYRVAPGLYGGGKPGPDSPVLVTANYKLSFDALRKELAGLDCWILVLDTCGINVWCAAGKGTFSSEELVNRVLEADLDSKVNHRKLILPQLGAVGVAAQKVRLQCGFKVVYGPVRAADLRAFLDRNLQASEAMRTVTFSFRERFELIPVELYTFSKKVLWIFPLLFVLSGIGPAVFSLEQAWQRGVLAAVGMLIGVLLGTVILPLLLPWLPGRRFSLKGAVLGVTGAMVWLGMLGEVRLLEGAALSLLIAAVSSYLGMNFTGSTPYTSPTGVEKEMRGAIPLQIAAMATATITWLVQPFL